MFETMPLMTCTPLTSYTSIDDYTLVVTEHDSLDFGLIIFEGEEQVFFSPDCLLGHVYGYDYSSNSEECKPWSSVKWYSVLEEDHLHLLESLLETKSC